MVLLERLLKETANKQLRDLNRVQRKLEDIEAKLEYLVDHWKK